MMVIMKCPLHVKQILEKKAHLVPNICVHNPGHTRWRRASLCPNDSFLFKNLSNPNPEGKNGNLLEIGNWKSIFFLIVNTIHTPHTPYIPIPLYCYAVSMIYQRYGYAMYVLIMYGMYGMVHALHYIFIHLFT